MNSSAVLYQSDCFDALRLLPEHSVSLVLCDPPYGVTRNPDDRPLDFRSLWPLIWRVAKPNAAVILFGQGAFSAELIMSQRKFYRYSLVWDKQLVSGHLNAKRMPLRRHEDILVFYQNQPVYHPQMSIGTKCHSVGKAAGKARKQADSSNRNYGTHNVTQTTGNLKYPHSVLSFQKPHPSACLHPTEKPVALLEYLIRTYSDPGDTVLDFCMGSGSTGAAAMKLGRKFVGCELNPQTFQTAKQRITSTVSQPDLFSVERNAI